MKRVRYDYETFAKDLHALADSIPERFDAIVAIARGGMTMAHLLGEYWGIRNVFVINSIGYNDTRKLEKVKIFNVPDLTTCRNVLIVDDIADSGETLKAVTETLTSRYPGKTFKTATLFYKPDKSIVEPDYWLKSIEDEWIDFFWSDDLKMQSF
ncbi:phosphoribosyltransferase family protein [Hydrogenimonas sp.]|uniref:phosphoribosyltransferase n=1 Tax=Hydrogenimonas sp. TaxID=2231112 RepID=UPI00263028D9|nr:phosphoribosyltransferase family protein [Hydrogenimonas sp.]